MRPLRYYINLTLDGCVDHEAGMPDEETHRHATGYVAQADALLFGRVVYQMMEAGWRHPVPDGERPAWTAPFAQVIAAAKKYVVSNTLETVDWNAELLRGDLKTAVEQLKREPGHGLLTSGVSLALTLAELGLIDEYIVVIHPRIAGRGPTLFAGLSHMVDLQLIDRQQFASGALALRYQPRRTNPLQLL